MVNYVSLLSYSPQQTCQRVVTFCDGLSTKPDWTGDLHYPKRWITMIRHFFGVRNDNCGAWKSQVTRMIYCLCVALAFVF